MKYPALQPLTTHLANEDAATEDGAALSDLYRRGTPQNTLRAWERDLAYIAAWKAARFGTISSRGHVLQRPVSRSREIR